jgi:hypothetical protein
MVVAGAENLEDSLPVTREAAFGFHFDSSVHDLGHTFDKVKRWKVGFTIEPKGFCESQIFCKRRQKIPKVDGGDKD